MEFGTKEVLEKSTAFSQTKADSDELKPDCMNSGSKHADRTAARERNPVVEGTSAATVTHRQVSTIQNVEKTVKVAQAQYTAKIVDVSHSRGACLFPRNDQTQRVLVRITPVWCLQARA